MNSITKKLIKEGYLKTQSVIDAFSDIGREDFVPESLESQANVDMSLPIGYGKIVQQPLTAAVMIELLNVRSGDRILSVGAGSGWMVALLAHIVGDKGKVIAIEDVKELVEISKKNIDIFGYIERGIVEVYGVNKMNGFKEKAPYDRIIVSASVKEVPIELEDELKVGGILVIPVENRVCLFKKVSEGEFRKEEYPGFSFTEL